MIAFDVDTSIGDIWSRIWALVEEAVAGGDGCPGFGVRAQRATFCVLGTVGNEAQALSSPGADHLLGGNTLSPGPSPSSPVYTTGTLSYSFCLSASKMERDTGEVPLFPHCDPGRTSGCRGDGSRPHCRPQGQRPWPCRAQRACMASPPALTSSSLSLSFSI